MRPFLFLLGVAFLLACSALGFAAEPCIGCEELAGAPQANLFTVMHEAENTIEITAFYENISATPSRQPITDSIILVELSNSTGLSELYVTYTDSEGKTSFDFSAWSEGYVNFRVLYCPFCTPDSPGCAFLECLRFANMKTEADYYTNIAGEIDEAGDIQVALDADVPLTINTAQYLPEIVTASYRPPPPPLTQTPALCLPLLIIFSLLGGSLYLTGRNPFAGFALGAPRIRKHIRYMPRGRGFSQSLKTIAMSIRAAATEMQVATDAEGNEIRMSPDGKPLRKGDPGYEKARPAKKGELAEPRWFGYSMVKEGLVDVIKGSTGPLGAVQPGLKERPTGGRRARPGIKKIGEEIGKAKLGSGDVKEWVTNIGLAVGRGFAAAWDQSWITYVAGEGAQLTPKLEKLVVFRERINEAKREMEHQQETQGEIGSGVSISGDTVILTDEKGNDYVEIKIGDKTVKATDIKLSGGTGEFETSVEGKPTTFRVNAEGMVGFTQVVNPEAETKVNVNFGVVEVDGKKVVQVTSVVETAPGVGPTSLQIARDDKGLVSQVGPVQIERNKAGEITGMLNTLTNEKVPKESVTAGIISAIQGNDGKSPFEAQSVSRAGLTEENLPDVTGQVNKTIQSTESTYMEGFGRVKVTDNDVLKTTDGNYKIVLEDPTYHPLGEKIEKPLPKGTVITVENGKYTSVKDAAGNEIGFEDHWDERGQKLLKTTIAGTDIAVGRGGARDAGAVREHMDSIPQSTGNIVSNETGITNHLYQKAGGGIFDENPRFFRTLQKPVEKRNYAAMLPPGATEQQMKEFEATAREYFKGIGPDAPKERMQLATARFVKDYYMGDYKKGENPLNLSPDTAFLLQTSLRNNENFEAAGTIAARTTKNLLKEEMASGTYNPERAMFGSYARNIVAGYVLKHGKNLPDEVFKNGTKAIECFNKNDYDGAANYYQSAISAARRYDEKAPKARKRAPTGMRWARRPELRGEQS